MRSYDDASILAELRRVAEMIGKRTLSARDVNEHARMAAVTVIRKLGSMEQANAAAGLVPPKKWTNAEMLAIVVELWERTRAYNGRSPKVADIQRYGCPVTASMLCTRFGTWRKTLLAAAGAADGLPPSSHPSQAREGRRSISARIRFTVFRRDNYTCQICKKAGVELEVDHIIPASKGGSDARLNLQAACLPCNRGKSDSMQ